MSMGRWPCMCVHRPARYHQSAQAWTCDGEALLARTSVALAPVQLCLCPSMPAAPTEASPSHTLRAVPRGPLSRVRRLPGAGDGAVRLQGDQAADALRRGARAAGEERAGAPGRERRGPPPAAMQCRLQGQAWAGAPRGCCRQGTGAACRGERHPCCDWGAGGLQATHGPAPAHGWGGRSGGRRQEARPPCSAPRRPQSPPRALRPGAEAAAAATEGAGAGRAPGRGRAARRRSGAVPHQAAGWRRCLGPQSLGPAWGSLKATERKAVALSPQKA